MASLGKVLIPSKKDHEIFVFPKKKAKVPFTRSRNKSYEQATAMEDPTAKTSTDFIALDSFKKSNQEDKLSTIMASLNKLHTKLDTVNSNLYRENDGVWCRLETAEESPETAIDNQEVLKFEMEIMKGVIHRQEGQIAEPTKKVNNLTARQMSANITILGLLEMEDENCQQVVYDFLTEKVEIDVKKDDILLAHRSGPPNKFKREAYGR